MESTGIEWADATVNFWWGCTAFGPDCDNCYAEAFAKRYGRDVFGKGKPRMQIRAATVATTLRKVRARFEDEERRPRIFTNSMADFFDDEVDPAWRATAWEVIRENDWADWLILTKRSKHVAEKLPADWGDGWSHVWLVLSAGNQAMLDARARDFVSVPARVRGLSLEPLFGPVDLRAWLQTIDHRAWVPMDTAPQGTLEDALRARDLGVPSLPAFNWVQAPRDNHVKPRLKLEVTRQPYPDAEREAAKALDALAGGLADALIAKARREVARERGVAEEAIDREHERVAEAARALSPLGVRAGHPAW